MSKSTKKFGVVICIVFVGLCIVFPSAYRKMQIRPFVKELVGNTWGHPSNYDSVSHSNSLLPLGNAYYLRSPPLFFVGVSCPSTFMASLYKWTYPQ